ncbi:hypothetical protein DPMN_035910 [Dreissena polymorpha]|uniref:EGF-like domain-containing protein n=1 Tax=Dreissena polymorpha TaxID=45954 RepID=A0A9D4M8G4_DREPO|nr:hypothetical protein DPMN_035910 [Dreissena polymorpha]
MRTFPPQLQNQLEITAESERLNDLTNLGLHICHGSAPIDVRCCPVGQDCTGKALVPAKCADVDRSNLVDGGNPGVRTVNDPTNYDVQFKCSLNRMFLSNTCTQKNDYCKPDPCVRGQCQLTFAGYSCSCPSGYTGKNCQTDINECATNPCSNGGTCTDKVNGYLCACKPEYTAPVILLDLLARLSSEKTRAIVIASSP